MGPLTIAVFDVGTLYQNSSPFQTMDDARRNRFHNQPVTVSLDNRPAESQESRLNLRRLTPSIRTR